MTDLESLYETLSRAPNDWETRGILADWYEDAGQQAVAEALRWMVRERKRPYSAQGRSYHWFNAVRVSTDSDSESDLPEPLYLQLTAREGLGTVFRDYTSLREAEEDFYRAFGEARRLGWTGDVR
jgi:hypothetical protein